MFFRFVLRFSNKRNQRYLELNEDSIKDGNVRVKRQDYIGTIVSKGIIAIV